MKLFNTINIDIIKYCQQYFAVEVSSILQAKRAGRFEQFAACINSFCNI